MKVFIYDIETYPNFISVVVKDHQTRKIHTFYKFEDYDNLSVLRTSLRLNKGMRLVGHNSLEFDDLILRAILANDNITTEQIYQLGKQLIEVDKHERRDQIPDYMELRYGKSLWEPIDTLELTRVNQIRASLKHAGIVLHHDRIQDLPIPPGTLIKSEQVAELLEYNVNDVNQTELIFETIKPLITLREAIIEMFGIDVLTANDTSIAKNLLDILYPKAADANLKDIKDLRTEHDYIHLSECIAPTIKFETPELQALLDHLRTITLYEFNKFKLPKYVKNPSKALRKLLHRDKTGGWLLQPTFDEITYKLGIGGLHSDDPAKLYVSDDTYTILEIDAASYYPNMIIQYDFFPAHLTEFVKAFSGIVEERLRAKAESKKDKAQGLLAQILKIAINSAFGLMGSKYYWLYDPKALISVTISGQLLLLDLVEKLYLKGIHTISANTDGINVRVHKDDMETMREVYHQVEKRSRHKFEETVYQKIVARDVNNYIAVKSDGSVKTKGVFQVAFANHSWLGRKAFFTPDLYNHHANGTVPSPKQLEKFQTIPIITKGYKHPIVSIALFQYFINGVDPETTIRNHDNIHEFMLTQRVDTKKFNPEFHEMINGELQTTTLQKTNRFIVSTEGGSLKKAHLLGGRDSNIVAGEQVLLLNDVSDLSAKNYPIKYSWYVDQAWDIIDLIDPPTPSLF